MKVLEKFDLLESPLYGTNLIEASAGTGKTHTITCLFLRLLLEIPLPVSQILVVTFTEAATGELKDRIRSRLREAAAVFSGEETRDEFLVKLWQKFHDKEAVLACLDEALKSFDQAPIFTIHSFCRRMLHEYAFESGAPFNPELITEQEDIKREIVDDFWRIHFYWASPLFVNYALEKRF
ncbi:MAG: UvrD-helicase domain-containing protein, partial [Deltaproteobacteria bacterium]|nr:UvrD-helicase domain-containing protein [Deltaproteobacteria bacterium]